MASTLRGTFTALVTPMNRDGSIDFGALEALVDAQLAGGITGLVPCGTTGEACTLTGPERAQVISRVAKRVAGRVPVIAGTGTNNTAESIEHHKRAQQAGATHALVVTPYYNKPSPEGLYRHHAALAEAVDLPIILYNIPGRTGSDMKPDLLTRIAGLPAVVGVKEASGDLDRVQAIRRTTRPGFSILSGDDSNVVSLVLLGGDGVISVLSNLLPAEMVAMVQAALDGRVDKAREWHYKLRDVMAAMFIESNPVPVKAAMARRSMLKDHYRLPLCEMQPENRKQLERVLTAGGWI